jgi:hypothetical protein
MDDQQGNEQPEQWEVVGRQFAAAFIEKIAQANVGDSATSILADGAGKIIALLFKLALPIGVGLAKGIADAEDTVGPDLAKMAAAGASDVFGLNVPESAFGRRGQGAAKDVAQGLGAGLLDTIKGSADGQIEPGDAGAQRYLGLVVNMALEGWYQGWVFEFLSSMVPQLDVGKIETFGELDDTLSQALGLGRLSRRVIGPLVDATCVRPFEWQCNKTYRGTLLGASAVARQWARGRWDWADVVEELARQGYSDERIDALINAERKFESVADVYTLVTRGTWDHTQGLKYLGEQGYDQEAAELALRIEGARRIQSQENALASAIVNAFASRDIEESQFTAALNASIGPATERALNEELGRTKRALNVKHMTSGQVADCVMADVLAIPDYRRALEREGYPDEEVIALELLLEKRKNIDTDVDKARAEKEAARAAAEAQKQAEAAKKAAAAEQAALLARRGNLAELRRAAVRGVVPFARVEELLAASFDADYVAAYMQLVEQDRQAYLDQQAKADAAAKRGLLRHVDVGTLQQAVYDNVVDIGTFRAQLAGLGFDEGDVSILVAVTKVRYDELAAAKAKRAAADAAAKKKSIDLGRFESLVRRGVRSLAEYAALLRSLGFDDASIADMRELLQLQIADDAAAAKARADAAALKDAKGVTLEQFRRAVILGTRTIDELARWLIDNKFTADAQILILDEARADVADAEAARQRRDETDAGSGPRALPLSTVARAARLGIITPDVYEAQLRAFGYDDDAVAIEMTLLIKEIADVRAVENAQASADAGAKDGGLSLAQLAAAVRAGVRPLSDYQARAATLVGNVDDVNTLVRVLADQLASADAARARRQALGSTVKVGDVAIGVLEAQVRAGQLELDAYAAQLVAAGVDPVDVDLLVSLLVDELAG